MRLVYATGGILDPERPGQGCIDLKGADLLSAMPDGRELLPRKETLRWMKKGCAVPEDWQLGRAARVYQLLAQPERLSEQLHPMLERLRAEGISCPVLRAPAFPECAEHSFFQISPEEQEEGAQTGDEETECRLSLYLEAADRLAAASIALAEEWKIGAVLLSLPFYRNGRSEQGYNLDFLRRAGKAAAEKGIRLLLAAQALEKNGHFIRGSLSAAGELCAWVDRLNEELSSDCFGIFLDTGVLSLCGQDAFELMRLYGKRMAAAVIRDTDGRHNDALLPFTAASGGHSMTDWLPLFRGLRDCSPELSLILDIRDTAKAFSPLLRPGLLRFSASVLEYFRWQTGLEASLQRYRRIVLFGAGNMCRNFMLNYGEQYPPLFTCDNNASLWGTDCAGLTVKSPEALLSLPEDCGIFICNSYYREIEEQLRTMGLKNIERFNDEYLPRLAQ